MKKSNLIIKATLISLILLVVLFVPTVNALIDNPYDNNKEVSEEDILELVNNKIGAHIVLEEGKKNGVYIEPEIYETLEENGEAMVIVWLKRDPDSYDVDDIKERVKENQDTVLTALKKTEEKTEEVNTDDETVNEEKSSIEENFRLVYRYEVSNGFAGIINKKGLEIVSQHELVESVYGEKILHTALAESVPLINANRVWAMQINSGNVTGTGQTVCVVDTGVNYNHPDLGGCFGTGCKVKGGWDFINNDNDPMDDQGHGTHVAGIAAANGNVVGVAPGAELIAVKVCDNTGSAGNCPGSAMIAGVDYCVANINTLGTDVITISIGDGGEYGPNSGTCPQWMNTNLRLAAHMNIPISISSGNEVHNNGIAYPSCSPNVISVGATYDANIAGSVIWNSCSDTNPRLDNVTCFSNTGVNLDVVAPGAMITSTHLNGNYGNDWGGTSMAAPHIAGTITLLKKIIPSLTPFQLESVLKRTGVPVTDPQNGLTFRRADVLEAINYFTIWNKEKKLTSTLSAGSSLALDAQRNVHIVWQDGRNGQFIVNYYKKLDSNGNVLVNDLALTFNNTLPQDLAPPSLTIDGQGNVHIAWTDCRDGDCEIYYKKLNNNGNVLVNNLRLTSANGWSDEPSLDMDNQGNVHLAWTDSRNGGYGEIYYKKLNNNGIVLINDTRLTTTGGSGNIDPSLAVDSQGNVHIAWTDGRSAVSINGEIYYTKLNNNGLTLVDDRALTYHNLIPGLNILLAYAPSLAVDTQGNVHIAWTDSRNATYGVPVINSEIYYSKLNNSGSSLISNLKLTDTIDFSQNPSLATDAQGNVHLVWSDNREGTYWATAGELYYKKLNNNGTALVNDKRITFNVSRQDMQPSLGIDVQGGLHITWYDRIYNDEGTIYYTHTSYNLPPIELVGTPAPGSTISLQLNSPLNANQNYIFGLALGTSPGFNLGNHHIPLNPDFLLSATMSNPSSAGLSNSMGTLNANGQATVSLAVPNLQWLSGWTVYGGLLIFDSQGQISGISDPVQINII